jgi:hypothetical protein
MVGSTRRHLPDSSSCFLSGYQISQSKRYWVEKPFGWMKSVGLMRKVKLRGREKPLVVIHVHRGGLQSVADSEVAGGNMLKRLSAGRFGSSNRSQNLTRSPLPR